MPVMLECMKTNVDGPGLPSVCYIY